MRFTETELLKKTKVSLISMTKMLDNNKISINELSDFVPGWLHINALHSARLLDCCKKVMEDLELTSDDVKNHGDLILKRLVHPDSIASGIKNIRYLELNPNKITTTFQQVRKNVNQEYEWYYLLKRKISNEEAFCITQPVANLGSSALLMAKFLEIEPWLEKKYMLLNTLTLREKEILKLVASGNSTAEIADNLFISKQTVSTHRKTIKQKLQIKSITELVRIADYYL